MMTFWVLLCLKKKKSTAVFQRMSITLDLGLSSQPVQWQTPLIPALGWHRQVDLCVFKASLCREGDPVSTKLRPLAAHLEQLLGLPLALW